MSRSIEREESMYIVVNYPIASLQKGLFEGFSHTHFLPSKKSWNIARARDIFVLSSAPGLSDVAEIIHKANAVHRLRAVLVFEPANQNWVTRMLDDANLRTLRNLLVHSDWQVAQRILTAWKYKAENSLIADAAIFGETLYVQDCALNTYKVPLASIKALSKIPRSYRHEFIISEEGSHISWAAQDVDLDLDSLRTAINPKAAAKAKARRLAHDKPFGAAVEHLRKANGLKQNEIPGLSDRQLRRIERGENSATLNSLECLAKAHSLTLDNYLNQIAECSQELEKSGSR